LADCKGVEIARRLNSPHNQALLILMSGVLDHGRLKAIATKAGFDYFLAKPIVNSELEVLLKTKRAA
jgi:hypothetical protein